VFVLLLDNGGIARFWLLRVCLVEQQVVERKGMVPLEQVRSIPVFVTNRKVKWIGFVFMFG